MHPLTGQRLDLWRLKNFEGTRLPSAEDTYLFHCVAPDNPADERLVALAEVRDVTPVRDAAGQVTRLSRRSSESWRPAWRASAGCRPSAATGRRLDANRVFLYVWPPIEVPAGRAGATSPGRPHPLTVGAGLEEIMVLARLRDRPDAEPTRGGAVASPTVPARASA